MPKVSIQYTPNFSGATPVKRQHNFATSEAATQFLNRMKKLYPDTIEI